MQDQGVLNANISQRSEFYHGKKMSYHLTRQEIAKFKESLKPVGPLTTEEQLAKALKAQNDEEMKRQISLGIKK